MSGTSPLAVFAHPDDESLFGLLGLCENTARRERFRLFMTQDTATYRDALGLLCHDAEGAYFLYRFTDPTFVAAETLLRAIGQQDWTVQGRTLDLCGSSGHVTRVLTGLRPPGEALVPGTVLADVYFWKLWLAGRFTVPDSGAGLLRRQPPATVRPRDVLDRGRR